MDEPKAEQWLEDVETIKVVADKRRLAILRLMQERTTVKAIAAEMDIPASKLYYHVNMLEKHELIRVVDHNIEAGIVEKIYQVTARQLKIVNPLLRTDLPDDTADLLFHSMLEETTQDFRQAYATRDKDEAVPPRHPFLSKKAFRLTDEQLSYMHGKLVALIEEVTELGERNEEIEAPLYDLTVVFFKQKPEDKK
ncbi:MAG TPA: helix-turn-helix domain-containing protein [Anaerolineae bacterium]|nr:helix-turn-helix domain-containing protein [Anaerolineae bacterium]